VNLRAVQPEGWLKRAHNAQVIQLQLDHLDLAWKVSFHIARADVQTHHAGVSRLSILGLNHHFHLWMELEYGVYAVGQGIGCLESE
jgi:hypothetical protein